MTTYLSKSSFPTTINDESNKAVENLASPMEVTIVEEKINVELQNFKPFERDGFAVVEWGGCVIK